MIRAACKLSLLVVSVATVCVPLVGTALGLAHGTRQFVSKELCDALLTLPLVLSRTIDAVR